MHYKDNYKLSDLDEHSEFKVMGYKDGSTRENLLCFLGDLLFVHGGGGWRIVSDRFRKVTRYSIHLDGGMTDKEFDFHIKNYQRARSGAGCVYILTNGVFDDLKIGKTRQCVNRRKSQVCQSNTGRGYRDSELTVLLAVYTDSYSRLEAVIHKNLAHLKLDDPDYPTASEWFRLSEEKAVNFMMNTYGMITA